MSVEAEGAAGAETRVPRDSLYGDAEKVSDDKHHGSGAGWWQTLQLAFQSIGVVYGDVGTSPLYVYSSTFPDGIRHPDDLLGVLSLIIYTLVLLPMLKYVFIVLYANDNGDGGTFALYSLISRYAKIRLIPNQQAEDASVSNYSIEEPNSQMRRAQWVKQRLESSKAAKIALFTITILGTSMVMGDGTLTPAISVLSAVSGIREKAPNLTQSEVVWISVAILFLLFSVQRFGTDKVGYSFAPIISVWFIFIAGIGVYNLAAHDVTVLRAFNPKYIVDYFGRNGKEAWVSLGGVVLCITGTEAMFADLGHFNIRAIQLSFTFILFPSVALCYMGQASYLRKFPQDVGDTFYKSIPAAMFWPTFIVAIMAAIIASQAMLSGAFAILSKALSLGCFPRVKVVHTSNKYSGQVYIPEVNFLIGAASIVVTLAFQTTTNIGNAYGICVVTVFSITTHLMTVVMLLIWKKNIAFVVAFYVIFGLAEFLYLSSILSKFVEGGYLPFCFSLKNIAFVVAFYVIFGLAEFLYLSSILSKFVEGGYLPFCFSLVLMALMATWHYVYVKRYWVGPAEHRMFRCVARYGYTDQIEGTKEFSAFLIEGLKLFVHDEAAFSCQHTDDGGDNNNNDNDDARRVAQAAVAEEEKRFIDAEVERGVVYLMGEAEVAAAPGSSVLKRIVVNYVYTFLRKNLSESHKALSIPKDQLLKVGITYEI
uniref:Potassium transporter n=1 Tax=Aegilops tauschii TaxID=37682 RepID=M8CUN8_AEGTA